MKAFTIDDLRALSKEDILSLQKMSKNGDSVARWKLAMCVLYKQIDSDKNESVFSHLTTSSADYDENELLLMGYVYEHAIGTPKNYAKAVECYSKAYDLLNKIQPSSKGKISDASKALKEMQKQYDKLIKQISKVIAIKKFCLFKDEQFLFPWNDDTRDALGKLLPQLSNDIAEFGALYAIAITNLKDEAQGDWEFCYQDTLLMPVEVMKTLVARDYFEHYLKDNGFQTFPTDPYFNNALGRCLIDDDDAYDNDYIIGGLLNMAGHEENPLWQYRAGLWYEYCDNNLEPQTAEYWYEQAKKELPAAKTALERLQNSLNYRILVNAKEGTAKDCQTLMKRSSKNPQNSIGWIIESALRGDESAIQRLENNQFSPKGQSSILGALSSADDNQQYYTLLKKEIFADKKAFQQWENTVLAEKEAYRKRIEEEARRKAEAERRRLEAERKAKEEAIRKAREAEEAKRRAEEVKRRAEEEAKRRAEEAKRRAEAEAIRKAKEAEEAERKRLEAERKAKEEAKLRAEAEAKRRAEEDCIINKLIEDMVLVEGGKFMMGTTYYTRNISTKPAHRVKLSPYKICRYEVTLEQWLTVMGSNPTTHRDKKRPVVGVSWSDCQEFISKLNAMSNMKFRLPTEAEWEFAALGGVKSRGFYFAGSDKLEDVAWTCKNSGDRPLEAQKYEFDFWDKETLKNNHCRTHDVGQKKPNELGLYDMCGNVWEWCADWYGDYCASDQENPKGPTSGTERVQRGGCYWVKEPADVKKRSSGESNKGWNNVGFRLALDPTPEDLAIIEEKEKKFKAAIKSYNGHDYVDLGLPSGTLWATCNIGASKPEEFGNYFSWGETTGYDEGKREFDEQHYKFRTRKIMSFGAWKYTKYVENKENGSVDNKLTLDKEDDAAYVQWGDGWRMPTTAQFEELINPNYTTIEFISKSGVKGMLITSKPNGNSLFLPGAGYLNYSWTNKHEISQSDHRDKDEGRYWTRDRSSGPYNHYAIMFTRKDHDDCANRLAFGLDSDDHHLCAYIRKDGCGGGDYGTHTRCYGFSIRPVRSK